MDHRKLRDALSELHDGELDAAAQREVLAHLDHCPDCRQERQRWQSLARAAFPPPRPISAQESSLFAQNVMRRIRQQETAEPASMLDWLGSRWAIPALSFGLALVLLSIMLPQPESLAPLDVLFLVDLRDRTTAELVLPPDPSRSDSLLTFSGESK